MAGYQSRITMQKGTGMFLSNPESRFDLGTDYLSAGHARVSDSKYLISENQHLAS